MLNTNFQIFHITVKALIVHQGKLILMKSAEPDRPNDLEPPGGRINQNESLENALKRELLEEIDFDLDQVHCQVILFDINERAKEEYDWDDKTKILEVYYLIKVPAEMDFKVYPKTESNGLVYIDSESDLDKYTYTAKGRKEILKKIQKLLKSP